MSRRRALLLCVALAALVGGAAVWAWLPWNPFEGSAGALDRMLPPDVHFAVRFAPQELRRSQVLDRIATHPQLRELLAERTSTPVEDLERSLDRLTAAEQEGGSFAEDLFGTELVVARRGEHTLALSRISGRGKVLLLVRRLGDERLARFGLRRHGELLVVDSEPAVYVGRHRDVLVLATEPSLVGRAIATATDGLPSLADAEGYDDALRRDESPGATIHAWVRPASFAEDVPPGEEGSAGAFWRSVFPPERLEALTLHVDATRDGELRLVARGRYAGQPPASVAGLAGSDAAGLAAAARRFATGETMIACGVATSAADAIRALLGSQPPERRRLLDQVLEDEKLTVDVLAEELGAHFAHGVGAVVARLDEADRLDLDDWDHGAVYPVPATLVLLRFRDAGDPSAALRALWARAELLFGSRLEDEPVLGPGGARTYALEEHALGAEWALFRPCVAVLDEHLLFATSEAYLRRALALTEPLAARARRAAPVDGRQVRFELLGEHFRRYVDDQRWEFAERATFHDWARERRAIHEELDRKGSVLRPEDREAYVDARIRDRIETRNEERFPLAIERYREDWRWLELLDGAEVGGTLEGSAFRLEATIRVRE